MTGQPCGTVAVIDDDQAVRDSLCALLEAAGYHVESYEFAEQFLRAPRRRDIRCLLLDQHMPRTTGLDLLAAIRDRGDTLPVVLFTGALTPDLAARAVELGAFKVLQKPMAGSELIGCLEAAVAANSAAGRHAGFHSCRPA